VGPELQAGGQPPDEPELGVAPPAAVLRPAAVAGWGPLLVVRRLLLLVMVVVMVMLMVMVILEPAVLPLRVQVGALPPPRVRQHRHCLSAAAVTLILLHLPPAHAGCPRSRPVLAGVRLLLNAAAWAAWRSCLGFLRGPGAGAAAAPPLCAAALHHQIAAAARSRTEHRATMQMRPAK